MKMLVPVFAAASLAAPQVAAAAEPAKPAAEILERDAAGRPTKVRMDGQVYTVCTADNQDGCINPREAGLPMGNVPLDHWPGRPASEIKSGTAVPSSGKE